MAHQRGFKPRALGEIAIRCADLAEMARFYGEVIGLERLSGSPTGGIIFFKIAEGFGGHTSVLALFHHTAGRVELHRRSDTPPVTGGQSSLHHFALSLPYEEQDAVMRWFDEIDQPYRAQIFDWIGWRGIFTEDPEGNTVEFVAYDASLVSTSG